MNSLVSLAWQSLANRKSSAFLTVLSIALSVTLFLGIDKIRQSAEDSFQNTISGTDVIVGARSGPINLLLYSVFRIGNATSNISWESYEALSERPNVAWTIPLSLGDSHRGYRVLGTTDAYFEHYQYGNKRTLTLSEGQVFAGAHDAVLGAEVARSLGYALGDEIVISHGLRSFSDHDHAPFKVTGILAPTGTPVDRTVHVTLAGIEAAHEGFHGAPPSRPRAVRPTVNTMETPADTHEDHEGHDHGDHEDHGHEEDHHDHESHAAHEEHEGHDHAQDHDTHESHEEHEGHDHDAAHEDHHDHEQHEGHSDHEGHDHDAHAHGEIEPAQITAFLVGLENRSRVLTYQRDVNTFTGEPLLGVIPGVALTELWSVVGAAETALLGTASLVIATGLLGLLTSILTSLNERRREMAVLRAAGARRGHIFTLLVSESVLLAGLGCILGSVIVYGGLAFIGPMIEARFGIPLTAMGPSLYDGVIIGSIIVIAGVLGLVPAWRAYKNSLADGLTVKL